jgi:hypothetical protein
MDGYVAGTLPPNFCWLLPIIISNSRRHRYQYAEILGARRVNRSQGALRFFRVEGDRSRGGGAYVCLEVKVVRGGARGPGEVERARFRVVVWWICRGRGGELSASNDVGLDADLMP